MILKKWDNLPKELQLDEVRPYHEALSRRKGSLLLKRLFDIVVSIVMLIILSPIFLILSIAIKIDSRGPVFFRQERVTQYGKTFRIYKFRTMVSDADKIGTQVTIKNDIRITRVGSFIRDCRLDEIPQLINIFVGDMTFVGTRPEVKKYVDQYTNLMKVTLLLPAGVTSLSSIKFKDEAKLLTQYGDIDKAYVEKILPEKMKFNIQSVKEFSLYNDIKLMLKTVQTVFSRNK